MFILPEAEHLASLALYAASACAELMPGMATWTHPSIMADWRSSAQEHIILGHPVHLVLLREREMLRSARGRKGRA